MVIVSSHLDPARWSQDATFEPLTYEKIIGVSNLLRIAWLNRGLELAAPVCRVVTGIGDGSGFLVANDIVLTNHHVIPTAQIAAQTTLEFNYQVNWAGDLEPVRRYTLDGASFRASKDLDYALVRVNGSPGDVFGFVDLTKRAAPTVNDYVSIIQHPQGGPKEIAFTDNKVAAVFGDVLQYATDTEPGSSGSPVFNQQWQIVALHHAGGSLAGPDGQKYFTNEGILVSSILRDAAAFLGISDTLYALAFGELRADVIGLVTATSPPANIDDIATKLLLTHPRFPAALDDSVIVGGQVEAPTTALASCGVAIGAALRQWARDEGHEAIATVAAPVPPPSDPVIALVSTASGSGALPRDVYASVLAALRRDAGPVAVIAGAGGGNGEVALARAFLRGVVAGAAAYGPSGVSGPRATGPPVAA